MPMAGGLDSSGLPCTTPAWWSHLPQLPGQEQASHWQRAASHRGQGQLPGEHALPDPALTLCLSAPRKRSRSLQEGPSVSALLQPPPGTAATLPACPGAGQCQPPPSHRLSVE